MKQQYARLIPPSWSALRLRLFACVSSPASLRLRLVAGSLFSILALTPFAAPASAQTTLNGGSYTFNTPQDTNGILANNGASITLQTGSTIGSGSASVGLGINTGSILDMQGGSIVGNSIGLNDAANTTSAISGCSISSLIAVKKQGSGIINITGGSFSCIIEALGPNSDC